MGKYVWSAGDRDVDAGLRKQERCVLVAGVCLACGAVLVLGWLAYQACMRWPELGRWSPVLGWALSGYGVAVAAVKCVTGR